MEAALQPHATTKLDLDHHPTRLRAQLAYLQGNEALSGHPEAARARLKTGRLDGVRAMAGYVRTPGGRILAVVALQEQAGVHRTRGGTDVQDALLRWLLDRD